LLDRTQVPKRRAASGIDNAVDGALWDLMARAAEARDQLAGRRRAADHV